MRSPVCLLSAPLVFVLLLVMPASAETGLPVKVVNAIMAREPARIRHVLWVEIDGTSYMLTFAPKKLKSEGVSVGFKEGGAQYIVVDTNLDGTPDAVSEAIGKGLKIVDFPTMTTKDQGKYQAIFDRVLRVFLE